MGECFLLYRRVLTAVLLLAVLIMLVCSAGCDDDQTAADGLCSSPAVAEPAATGDYRAMSYRTPYGASIGSVAIADRGIRAVAGGQDYGVYLFSRDRVDPLFAYETTGQVRDVDITRDGRAVAAAGGGEFIYLFSCDSQTPLWSYDTGQDITWTDSDALRVAFSPDGEWLAAVSETHVYLFRTGEGTPVFSQMLSEDGNLATVAVSNGGTRIAVGNRGEEMADGEYHELLYLLDQSGLLWQADLGVPDAAENWAQVEVAISADGHTIAAGGGDRAVHLWSDSSSVPRWSYTISDEAAVASVALSDRGKELLVTGDSKLYFFGDTSKGTPSYIYNGAFCIAEDESQDFFGCMYRDVYPGMTNEPGYWGIGNYPEASAISADGLYYLTGDYNSNHAFNFFREVDCPFRLYDTLTGSIRNADLASDGSWVILGTTSGEVMRIEVAPAEMIEVEQGFTYEITQDQIAEGAEAVDIPTSTDARIRYWIIKPGRAAKLTETWSFWQMMGVVPIAAVNIPGQDDRVYTWEHDLPEGNQYLTGTRDIPLPRISIPITSYDDQLQIIWYLLISDLTDSPTGKELSRDMGVTVKVVIGTVEGFDLSG